MATKPGMQTQQQKEWTVKLAKIKGYLSEVYQEIECTTFMELEAEDSNANEELLFENKEQKNKQEC